MISPSKFFRFVFSTFLAVSLNHAALAADFRAAHIFQDHMVLQRDKPVPVWGWAEPGASVTVKFAGQEKSAKTDEKGYWKAVLDPMPASAEGCELTVSQGTQTLTMKDVLVGEVWLCSGQSNMARTLKHDAFEYPFFTDYANDAEYPAIRFINYATDASDTPREDFDPLIQRDTHWQLLNKTSAMSCMSIPFFFAKDLNKALGVPIGLVEVAVAGTPQTSWMAKETLDAVGKPGYDTVFKTSEQKLAAGKYPFKSWAEFLAADAAWRAKPTGRWPGATLSIPDYPGVLYNAMIHPAAPFAIQGVLWHQGEGGPAANYRERLLAHVAQWRKLFGQDFYFIWGTMTRKTTASPPTDAGAESFRGNIDEEFLLAEQDFGKDGKTVLVNFYDLGNTSTHWGRKDEGGHRMAGAALAEVYGKPETVFTGPEMVEAKIDGATVRVKFRHVGGGLVYEPSVDGISGFLLEEGGTLRWANVAVDGDTVVLSYPDVKKPINAYYSWHGNPHETLFNREGYPAYRFRAIPRVNGSQGTAGPALVELISGGKDPKRVGLNLSHVRRNGFIFNVVETRATGKATVRVRIPKEWEGATFTANGQPVETGETKTDEAGYQSYEFAVDLNGPDITVANAGSPPDFAGIHRY